MNINFKIHGIMITYINYNTPQAAASMKADGGGFV